MGNRRQHGCPGLGRFGCLVEAHAEHGVTIARCVGQPMIGVDKLKPFGKLQVNALENLLSDITVTLVRKKSRIGKEQSGNYKSKLTMHTERFN